MTADRQGQPVSPSRRRFHCLFGLGALSAALPLRLHAATRPQVVVVGGGAGGATAARYLAKDAGDSLDVILIDEAERYTSCFYSNLYLGGFRSFESITHDYDALSRDYGVQKITARATSIDREAQTIALDDGTTIAYDRLVLSPGIDIDHDSVPGYSVDASDIAPHAWQGGVQTERLKTKLDGLQDGDSIVLLAPPNPYRCPPGPYERVSMMAHRFKKAGFSQSRITIIDTKDSFSKQALFMSGWERHYPGVIEWLPPAIHGGVVGVDVEAGAVQTDFGDFEGALLNIIPAQRAGAIAVAADLTDDTGYCPIDATSMRSTRDSAIFVIGDASRAGAMPKSGFSANSQAKVAAMNIRGDLIDARVIPARYANTCWSLVAEDDGVKVGASYAAVDNEIVSNSSFISEPGESDAVRKATYRESIGWYTAITHDMFGDRS